MLQFAARYDSMYREGLDGYIGIKRVPDERDPSGHSLEMITILDLQAIYESKHHLARRIADQFYSLRHENLLNLLRPMSYGDSHVSGGLMVFETEAPDHRCSWKTFCKLDFDLESLFSMFRMLT